jgi:hypothetical protein
MEVVTDKRTAWGRQWERHKIQLHRCYTIVKYGEERETKQVNGVLTHSNYWLNQDEASVKQEETKTLPTTMTESRSQEKLC